MECTQRRPHATTKRRSGYGNGIGVIVTPYKKEGTSALGRFKKQPVKYVRKSDGFDHTRRGKHRYATTHKGKCLPTMSWGSRPGGASKVELDLVKIRLRSGSG